MIEEIRRVIKNHAKPLTEDTSQSVRNFLESQIHQSFTVACDKLFALGLLDRDERIKLSGLIGQTLKQFGESIPSEMSKKMVDADTILKLIEEDR